MKKYMKEHGSDALEDLIASTKKSAKPDVSVKAIRADDAEDLFRTTSGSIPKDSNDVEITEKIEVASPKQTSRIVTSARNRKREHFHLWRAINTATTAVGGGDLCGIVPSRKGPKGKRRKKACEPLNFKNQASNSNVSPASVGRNLD
ncbi:hypothetical protein NC651_037794 [Populus alba x Populus x berolinensis]|nr:hypothetical protein NC651_037794 [Populus alba x Populus x berolinensis]